MGPTPHQDRAAAPARKAPPKAPEKTPKGAKPDWRSTMRGSLKGMDSEAQSALVDPSRSQLRGGDGSHASAMATALEGQTGAGGPLPFLATIQRSFGHHDAGTIKAHVGPEASQASRAMGAKGYTALGDVSLGDKSLRTAAHEATHAVLQRAGKGPAAGGRSGDTFEKQADEVADKVTRGESVEGLLDGMVGGGGRAGGAPLETVQRSDAADAVADATSRVNSVAGYGGTGAGTALFLDYVVANRGNPVMQWARGGIDDAVVMSRLGPRLARGLNVAGRVAGVVAIGAEIADIWANGLNLQNGANLVVNFGGLVGGPLFGAFAAGYSIGQLLDNLLGISNWVASFAGNGDAGVDITENEYARLFAEQGDAQCARLLQLQEQLAGYENRGAQALHRQGVDTGRVDPEELQERGRAMEYGDRVAEHQASQAASGASPTASGAMASLTAASQEAPAVDNLKAQIDEHLATLRDRISELRDAQSREEAIWSRLESLDREILEYQSRQEAEPYQNTADRTITGGTVRTPVTHIEEARGLTPME